MVVGGAELTGRRLGEAPRAARRPVLCQLVVWAGAWPPALMASSLLHNRKELGLTQWKGTWGDTAFSFCFFPFLFSNELSANAFRTLDEILTSPKCTAFSERGGSQRVEHEMPVFSRNEAENGEREMHRRLGGNGNPCRGGMGPLFHQRAFKETRTESGPQTMSEGGKAVGDTESLPTLWEPHLGAAGSTQPQPPPPRYPRSKPLGVLLAVLLATESCAPGPCFLCA